MSLLDTGPDTVMLYPATYGTDDEGNQRWLPGTAAPVAMAGVSVQDSTNTVGAVEGQTDTANVRVIGRRLPDGIDPEALTFGHVEWDGRRWTLDGRPRLARRTRSVANVSWSMTCQDARKAG